MGTLAVFWLSGVLGALVAEVASATGVSAIPSAFARPQVAADLLPRDVGAIMPGAGRPYDSRKIASLGGTKRSWSVYVFKVKGASGRAFICESVVTHGRGGGAGTGCSPSTTFFGPGREVAVSSGRVIAGVTTARVARVVIVGSRGVTYRVGLTPDHGFVWNCKAYNGCSCVVSKLIAYDKTGNRITLVNFPAPGCRRK